MSSLLEQAIIDAKMLKETARKNAEAAILEQYAEEIKSTIETLLEQDETGVGDTTGADLTATASPSGDASKPAADPKQAAKKIVSDIKPAYLSEDGLQEIEINLDSLVEKVSTLENEIEEVAKVVPQTVSRMPADTASSQFVEEELQEAYELDEELLAEEEEAAALAKAKFDADAAKKTKEAAELKAKGEEEAKKAAERKAEEEKKAKEQEKAVAAAVPEEGAIEEELELDMINVSPGGINSNEIELKKQADIRDALAAQAEELEQALESKEEEKNKLEEALDEAITQLQNTKAKLKKSVELNVQLKEGIEMLSTRIQDINILNAKLVYTNKTLGNSSLNERQKQQIAESISAASSVEEAKTIFETLQRSAAVISEKRSAPQSLTEAIKRAPSPFLPRKTNTVDPTQDRWKLLAGIKK